MISFDISRINVRTGKNQQWEELLSFQDSFRGHKLRTTIFVVNCVSQHFCRRCGLSWFWNWENVSPQEPRRRADSFLFFETQVSKGKLMQNPCWLTKWMEATATKGDIFGEEFLFFFQQCHREKGIPTSTNTACSIRCYAEQVSHTSATEWDLLGVIRQQWHLSALGLWQLYPFSCCRTSGIQCGSQQAHGVPTIPACRQLWRLDQETGGPKAWVWSQGTSPVVWLEASRSPRLPEVVLPCSEESAEPHCPRMCLRMLAGTFIKPTASVIYLLGSPAHCLWEKIKKTILLSILSHSLQKSLTSFPPWGHRHSKNILTANALMLLAKVSICGLMC